MIRIAKLDWDQVHELACDIANASGAGDSALVASKKATLMSLLIELEVRYGPCSKITATVADFTEEGEERPRLYQEALRLAKAEGDAEEERLILESIAEMLEDEKTA
jgi:hypothetical protein